ncbi:HNH endonuclease [Anatilimnocola sp. NA78]|uniref:HNH endonuclease n=1 Tax=Anatilimnocola sp. NA78 TaxID=3415683 RepID=UPI003CE4D6EC
MPFSEKIKLEAKRRSGFRCCVCHHCFVEVHHITPQAENGSNRLENAAPLCARCHDLYGGNPEKRTQIRQMRDLWWDIVAERRRTFTAIEQVSESELVNTKEDLFHENKISGSRSLIYHIIFSSDTFEDAAKSVGKLIIESQRQLPGMPRHLFVDIEGHLNSLGAFDHDMLEFQLKFILGAMMPFLASANVPLAAVSRTGSQRNDLPDEFLIFPAGETQLADMVSTPNIEKCYVANVGKWLRVEP